MNLFMRKGETEKVEVPAAIAGVHDLEHVDYVDAFEVKVADADARSLEEWARGTLEDAPIAMRLFLLTAWSNAGMGLGPSRIPGYIFSWKIMQSTPDFLVLGSHSLMGLNTRLVFYRKKSVLGAATFVQIEGLPGSVVWYSIAPGHRRVVPYLLSRVVRLGARGKMAREISPGT